MYSFESFSDFQFLQSFFPGLCETFQAQFYSFAIWTGRSRARLWHSECYKLDIPQWNTASESTLANLTLPDLWDSCSSNEGSPSIWLLYCDLRHFCRTNILYNCLLIGIILRWGFLIWELIFVIVSPVITAFHSCCLSHLVFDLVNLWPAWVGFETAIFWQCSPGTVVR